MWLIPLLFEAFSRGQPQPISNIELDSLLNSFEMQLDFLSPRFLLDFIHMLVVLLGLQRKSLALHMSLLKSQLQKVAL